MCCQVRYVAVIPIEFDFLHRNFNCIATYIRWKRDLQPVCDTIRIYILRYEWDEAKNLRNQRNHGGVSFELAALVFEDEFCLIVADRVDPMTGEQRWHAIGAVGKQPEVAAVLFVVHVYREEQNGEEIIRIISARAAEKHELRRYQKQTLDPP